MKTKPKVKGKPTFMTSTIVVDGNIHTVDRRPVPPTEFWNFSFECYDGGSRGDEWHVEGMLALHDGICEDFDGVFDLPPEVKGILKTMGFECPWSNGDDSLNE